MSDLSTYLDYGSTEISDDLNPERARQPEKQEPSNQRKKMLVDMLGTSLEYGGVTARQDGLYADNYSIPQEDIIPGANLWLQNENTGFTYDVLTELLQAADMQDGIDWAWSLQGAPTVQLDTASNVLAFANPFSAVIDYGHAAWDLASGDVSGARDAWNNVGDRLYGYDPNPYGSQVANVLGVHNWQDAVWAGLDVIDMISLGFGGEIIRPMRMAMANVIRRQGKNPEVAAAIYRSITEEWPERAIVRRAAEGEYILPDEGYLVTRRTNPALGTSFGSSSERPQGLYTSLFEEEGLDSSFAGLSDVAEFAVVKPRNVLDVSDVQADLAEMMGRGLDFIGGGQADTGVTALKHLAEQPEYTGQPLEWITRFTPEEQALREIPAESIPDWLRESGHHASYRTQERQLHARLARTLEYAETRFPDHNWRGMLHIEDAPAGMTGEELGHYIRNRLFRLNEGGASGLGGGDASYGLMQDPLGLLYMGLGASEARQAGYDAMIKRFPRAWGESASRTLGQIDPSTVNELVLLTDEIATPTDMADELLKAYRRGELPLSRQERLLAEWDELGEAEQVQIADEYKSRLFEENYDKTVEDLLEQPEVLMRWHNTEGRGYLDNLESQFTGLSRNDERAIWHGMSTGEREVIEADYRAVHPDKVDPDPAEMVEWYHQQSGRPESWAYYEDRSGRRQYKGADAFEHPERYSDADLQKVKDELFYSDAQWERAQRMWANDPQRIEDQVAREAERLDRDLAALNPDPTVELLEYSDLDDEVRDALFDIADGLKRSLGEHAEGRNLVREVEEYLGVTGTPEISDYNQFLLDNPDYDAGLRDAEARWDDPTLDPSAIWRAADEQGLLGPPNRPEGYNRPDGDPLDRRPGPEQRRPYPDTFTPDEIDQIVRNEGGLTDAEIEREMRRSGGYGGGGLTDSDLDRLARPEPGISADPLDEEIAREIGPGPGPGWKTANDIPASKAGQVWRTPDNVWGTATDEELLVLLHHARMEAKRKIDPSLSMMGENRQKEFLTDQQVDWASRELTNRGYTPTRGIDDPWQELNWGNIGVDRHPSGELFKDFDYEDTLLGIQAKVRSWYDTEYWPQQVANTKTGLQTAPDLDLDIGISGTRMGWTLPREEAPSVWGTRAGREAYSDGTEMRLRFYSEEKLAAYMDDRYFQPGNQPRALEYRKLFEDEYARRRAIEAETGKPYDPGPRPPGHPSTWRLPEGE